jgi:hypothetical protein
METEISKSEMITVYLHQDYERRAEAKRLQVRAREGLNRLEAELGAATLAYYEADQALDEHLLDLADVLFDPDYSPEQPNGYN